MNDQMELVIKQNERARQELIERTRNLLKRLEHGCTDGACDMHPPHGGMHTNGGCRCWRHMADDYLDCAALVENMPHKFYKRCWTTERFVPKTAPDDDTTKDGLAWLLSL